MKASLAIILAGVLAVAATPLDRRALVTKHDITTVTAYVYPDGSPATHLPQPSQGPDTAVVFFKEREGDRRPKVVVPTPEAAAPEPVAPQPAPEAPKAEPVQAPVQEEPEPVQQAPAQSGSSVTEVSLNAHNIHRSNHSAPAIQWDDNLASIAQTHVNSCDYGHNMKLGGGGYGQNIAMRGEGNPDDLESNAEAARLAITRFWYNDEFRAYPGFGKDISSSDGTFAEWGHLSQLVWAGTTHVGCAVKRCPAGTMLDSMDGWFISCNYKPRGNVAGAFASNVKAPKGMATSSVQKKGGD